MTTVPSTAANDEDELYGCPICQWRGPFPVDSICPNCGGLVGEMVQERLKPVDGDEAP